MIEVYIPKEPQGRLLLAQKVDLICNLEPDSFNPEVHIADLRYIVNSIHPNLNNSSLFTAEARWEGRRDAPSQGDTGLGLFPLTNNETNVESVKLGHEDLFRIGAYIVTKFPTFRGKKTPQRAYRIRFEHFFGRGEVNERLAKAVLPTEIIYLANEQLDPVWLRKKRKIPVLKAGALTISSEKIETVWRDK